jgi:hypothetical protein
LAESLRNKSFSDVFEVRLEFFNCVIGEIEVLWDRRRRRSCSGLRDQGDRFLRERVRDDDDDDDDDIDFRLFGPPEGY